MFNNFLIRSFSSYKRNLASFPKVMTQQAKQIILKHVDGAESFSVSFIVDNPVLNVNKQFNMSRNVNEEIISFLDRLNANLEKAITKKKKTKKDESPSTTEVFGKLVKLVKDGQVIEPEGMLKAKDFLFQPDIQLRIFDEDFDVCINPPIVESMKLPESIMAGFMVYPYKVSVLFANKEDARYEWFVSKSEFTENPSQAIKDWVKRSEGFFFVPSSEDINRFVKLICTPLRGTIEGIVREIVSKKTITAGPGECSFEERHMFTQTYLEKDEFRFVTYNLLADLYADSDFSRSTLFAQCPGYAMDIDYRKQLFIKELIGYHADIMCMQEVDLKIFEGDLLPVFGNHGYTGHHDLKGGQVTEGLACFWRSNRFRMVNRKRVVVSESIQSNPALAKVKESVEKNETLKETVLSRPTTVQLLVLEDINSVEKRAFVVGNTHLYFKPDADHIRLIQVAVVIEEATALLNEMKQQQPTTDFSLLIFGDFNSTPPFGVLDFIRNKTISSDHPDWSSCPGQEVKDLSLKHDFSMDSACGTPEYTTYTIGFKDCLDYIFYQKDFLEVISVVPFPLKEELEEQIGLPNVTFPSDHIASVADLKWKKKEK